MQDSVVASWGQDTEFQALPSEVKAEAIGAYFSDNVQQDFYELPEEEQAQIKSRFIQAHLPDESHEASPFDGGARATDFLGEMSIGLDSIGVALGKGMQAVGLDSAGEFVEGKYRERRDMYRGEQSEAYKQEMTKPFLEKAEDGKGFMGTGYEPGPGMTSPVKIGGLAAGSLPSTAASMGVGGALTKGLLAAGMRKGVAGAVGFGTGESAVASGMSASDVHDTVMQTPEDVLVQSEEYQRAYWAQGDDVPDAQRRDKARAQVAADAAKAVALPVAVSTFLFSAPAGSVFGRMMGGETGKTVAGTALKGAAVEAMQEGPQSALEKYHSNVVVKEHADPGQDLMEDVAEEGFGGAIAGAATGGVFGGGVHLATGGQVHTNTQEDVRPEVELIPVEEESKPLPLTEEKLVRRSEAAFPVQQDQFMERVGDEREVPLDLTRLERRGYPNAVDYDLRQAGQDMARARNLERQEVPAQEPGTVGPVGEAAGRALERITEPVGQPGEAGEKAGALLEQGAQPQRFELGELGSEWEIVDDERGQGEAKGPQGVAETEQAQGPGDGPQENAANHDVYTEAQLSKMGKGALNRVATAMGIAKPGRVAKSKLVPMVMERQEARAASSVVVNEEQAKPVVLNESPVRETQAKALTGAEGLAPVTKSPSEGHSEEAQVGGNHAAETESSKDAAPAVGLISISRDDIPLQAAHDAHAGTSMVPDKRAEQEQQDYVWYMEAVRDDLMKRAPQEKHAELAKELERFKEGEIKHRLAHLGAKSRVVSWMIAGRSNFPAARMEKRNRTEQNRYEEHMAWRKRALKAIERRMGIGSGSDIIHSTDNDATDKLQAKLDKLRDVQEQMKKANKEWRRTKGDVDAMDVGDTMKARVQEWAESKNSTKGSQPFPGYALRNNNAKLRSAERRLAVVESQQARPGSEVAFDGGRVVDDADAGRVRVYFDAKPDDEVRGKLKKRGFRWARSVGAWQRKRTPQALEVAREIVGAKDVTGDTVAAVSMDRDEKRLSIDNTSEDVVESGSQEGSSNAEDDRSRKETTPRGRGQDVPQGERTVGQVRGAKARRRAEITEASKVDDFLGESKVLDTDLFFSNLQTAVEDGTFSQEEALSFVMSLDEGADLLAERDQIPFGQDDTPKPWLRDAFLEMLDQAAREGIVHDEAMAEYERVVGALRKGPGLSYKSIQTNYGESVARKLQQKFGLGFLRKRKGLGADDVAGELGFVDDEGRADGHALVDYLLDRAQTKAEINRNTPKPKFSRRANSTKGIRAEEVSEVVDRLQDMAVNAPEVQVVQSMNNLPARVREEYQRRGNGIPEAAYDEVTGTVYFVADNIESKSRAYALWKHEAGLHNGVRGLFSSPKHYRETMAQVYRSAPRRTLRKIEERYGFNRRTQEGREGAAEEYLASVAEKVRMGDVLAPRERSIWKKIVDAVQRGIRRIVRGGRLSDWDIAQIVHDAVRWTVTGQPTGAARDVYQRATGEAMARPMRGSARFSRRETSDKEQAAQDYGRRVSEAARKWAQVVDDMFAGKMHPRAILQMGKTPDLLVELGAPDLPLTMQQVTFKKIVGIEPDPKSGHLHHLTKRQMKNLYAGLADPVAVMQPHAGKMEVVVEMIEDGKPVLAALDLDTQEGRVQVNSVATAFGHNRAIEKVVGAAGGGALKYMDPKRLDALEDRSDNLKRNLTASARVLRARRGRKIKFPSDVVKPVGRAWFSRGEGGAGEMKFSSAESEARFQEARRGIGDRRSMGEMVKDTWRAVRKSLSYHPHMSNKEERFAQAHEILRQLEAAPTAGKERAIRALDSITDGLSEADYELFTRAVILRDLVYEVDQEHALPFGFTPETVRTDARALADAVRGNKAVKKALATRKKALDAVKAELLRAGVMEEEQFHNPAYFRHQVITYAAERMAAQGKRGKVRKPRPGYAKKREGSLEDINANYLEAEFEYLHRAVIDVATADTIDKLADVYDKRAECEALAEKWKAEHQGGEKKTWRDFIPRGYTTWSPETGNVFFTAMSEGEKLMTTALEWAREKGLPGISKKDIGAIAAQIGELEAKRGQRYNLVIPEELALTLDDMGAQTSKGFMNAVFARPLTMWKQWVLMNPRRVIKYNLNNMSGDLDAVIAGNPSAIKKLPQALMELWQVMHPHGWAPTRAYRKLAGKPQINRSGPSARYNEALSRGVFDTGLTIHEIPEINKLEAFRKLRRGRAKDIPLRAAQAVWRTLKDYTQFRENWLRYAAYLDYVERLEAGESMENIGYGAARKAMVDGLPQRKDKAALLARQLVGDYGAISPLGKEIREKLIPFWSWMEVNTKRYNRLMANAFAQGVGQGIRTGGVLATAKGVKLTAWLGTRALLMYALIQAWNNLFFSDEEDELDAEARRRLHLTLGRDADGKVITLRMQGALSDYLQWVGLEDAVGVALEIEKGRATFGQLMETIGKAPVNKVAGGITPLIKTPVELVSKRSLWPDVFNPRVVRDRPRHFARLFSLEHETDFLRDKPSRGYWRSWVDAILYRNDPKEVAYRSVQDIKHDWLKRMYGRDGSSDYTSWRSQALRDFKIARKFGDKDAEAKALARLRELGVDGKAMRRSVMAMHPLYGIKRSDLGRFMRALSERERKQVKMAEQWFRSVYREKRAQ